ncbi:tetratricopeptide repeat protein [Belliella sp. DSM 111904]|uniref:Tetratricopeptide repeat protein n=1 Tax=Belliella filtrata TaxID=2923435 RepID=A0ABS9V086_9BACT|nr:tetratricopeptide repeat protein [Belliella filtrata]MCH7409835.1 tetratricopeptide repeat protein [Belliella filtrata]
MIKKTLAILGVLTIGQSAYAQSGLYQNSVQKTIDDHFELYDKQLFSASKFEFESLRDQKFPFGEEVYVDFYHAISALKIDNPASSDLVYAFIRRYPDHPKVNEAAHLLGNYFFEKRNYREAIPAYQKVDTDKIWPEQRSEVLFKLGYAQFQLGDQTNALNSFNLVKRERTAYTPDAYYYAGYIQMEAKQYDKAIADFKEAEKSNFYAGKVPYMMSGIYYRQGFYDELIAYAEPIIAANRTLDRKEEINLYLAEAYFEKRQFDKASANYDAFINAQRGTLERPQIYRAGVAQYEIQNYQRATDYFKVSAVENDKIGQVSSYYLGHSYLKLNNPQFASTSFQAAYKSDADPRIKEEALINYAKVNLERGSFQDAVTGLDTYLDTYPRGAYAKEAEDLLADALINTNNYLRAIEQIERMPNKSSRINAAYQKVAFYQGIVYYRDNKNDLATAYFDKAINTPIDKDLVNQAYFWKAENYAARENTTEAIRTYEKIQNQRPRANDPYLIKSHYGLGYAFFNTQQYNKAEPQFKQYVDKLQRAEDKENYDDALVRLGDIYYVQKKFPEALNTFRKAVNEGNKYADYAHFRSGVIQNFQNNNNEAINHLNQVIDNYSTSLYLEDAIFKKAEINMEMTRYSDAISGFTRLIDTRPNSQFIPFALEGRAIASYSLQRYDETIQDYKKILENHPNASNSESALTGLQEALALQNRSGEFSQYLSSYRKSNPDNKSLQNLEFEAAKSLYFSNSNQQAVKAFQDYLRNYPQAGNKAEALNFMAESYHKAGNKEEALKIFYQIDGMKDSPQRMRAVQRIGSIEMENRNYAKAIPYLREAGKHARNKLEEYEAFQGLMDAHYNTNAFDSVIVYADRVIGLGNVMADATPQALLLKAKAHFKKGNQSAAEDVLRDLVNDYKTVHGAEGLYLLAESYSNKGNYEQSNDAIFDFSAPFSAHAYWYGRSFILLADNFLKMGEDFQAKATLQSVVEQSADEEIKKTAQNKLSQIK